MQIRQSLSNKKKKLIKVDNIAENQDEIIDNLLQNDYKISKSNNIYFEKLKTDKLTCQCDLCELDLEYMSYLIKKHNSE